MKPNAIKKDLTLCPTCGAKGWRQLWSNSIYYCGVCRVSWSAWRRFVVRYDSKPTEER
jgi:hypothetical protein